MNDASYFQSEEWWWRHRKSLANAGLAGEIQTFNEDVHIHRHTGGPDGRQRRPPPGNAFSATGWALWGALAGGLVGAWFGFSGSPSASP